MSWNPEKGVLDRQAGVPRVALRCSTTRNPASISLNYPTRGESTWQVHFGVTRHPTDRWLAQQLREAFCFNRIATFARWFLRLPFLVREVTGLLQFVQMIHSFLHNKVKALTIVTGEWDLDGFSIAVSHYPRIGQTLVRSGMYDLVCYGHDHTALDSWVGDCLLLNPGELMGMNSTSTFAFVDTASREVVRETL